MGQGESQGSLAGSTILKSHSTGQVGLDRQLLLCNIMKARNDRKHLEWFLRREQVCFQTQDGGQKLFLWMIPQMKCALFFFFFFATNENHWKLLGWEQVWKDVSTTLLYILSHQSYWRGSAFSWGNLLSLVLQQDWRSISFREKFSWKFCLL